MSRCPKRAKSSAENLSRNWWVAQWALSSSSWACCNSEFIWAIETLSAGFSHEYIFVDSLRHLDTAGGSKYELTNESITYTPLYLRCQHNNYDFGPEARGNPAAFIPLHRYVYVVYGISDTLFHGGETCRDGRTLTWKARFWTQRKSYGRREGRRD